MFPDGRRWGGESYWGASQMCCQQAGSSACARECHCRHTGKRGKASHLASGGRDMPMTKSLLLSVVALAAVALAGCAEDTQTTQRDIDHDITVSHAAGSASLDDIGQDRFAPWRFTMQSPPP